jgi:low affinity Fe/Cu permease
MQHALQSFLTAAGIWMARPVAIQAKLDELLRANSSARSGPLELDKQEPEQIEAHRDRAKAGD